MRHGIYYAYWEKEWEGNYPYYVEKVAGLGFDILEIGAKPLVDYTKEQIKELRLSAANAGIEMTAGYGPEFGQNIGSGDSKIRKNGFEWFERLFEVLAELEIKQIGGALYSYWPVDFSIPVDKDADWNYSVEGIKKLGEIARTYGITLGMEVLNRFENHILNTSKEGVAFVKAVGLENVKVMLDTFHMNIEEESMGGAIRAAGKYLGHLHTGECNRLVPGRGRIPWKELGEALRDIDYNGTVVMEPFVKMGGTIGENIHVWRDLSNGSTEKELDEAARKALVFQKYMFE